MAPQPRLYISEDNSKKIYYPRKSKDKDKDVIPDGYSQQPFICPVTGDTWINRKEFWYDYVIPEGLDIDNLDYNREVSDDVESLSKLIDKSHWSWIWNVYFDKNITSIVKGDKPPKGKKDDKEKLHRLLGLIDFETYVTLVRIYKGEIDIPTNDDVSNKQFKMIDLFAGTGAFSKAFEVCGIQCCFANDFCKNSKNIFDMNHDTKLTYGDLNDIKNIDIPKHDILCAGFPCQPFSIAGKQAGFEDERSNVFWKIISIIDHHKPEIVILENVKNLKSHDKGITFKVIYDKLCNGLKYNIVETVLNTSKITDVPQNRERIYIVCFKDEEKCNKFTLDFEEKPNKMIKDFLESKTIPERYYYTDRFKVYGAIKEGVTKSIDENVLYQYRRYYVRENKNSVCPTLTANMGGGGHNVPLLKDKKGIRRLTPRECFNLQGFPDDYELPEICDSALYKLAGNAVSFPVVKLIAERVADLM